MNRFVATALGLSVALSLTSARAADPSPDDVERARTFFEAGAQAYATARYTDAVRSFERAYELAPRPPVLFSLAQAERKEHFATNDPAYLRRAIQHYQEYLDHVASGGRRSEATEAKADLEARLARLDPNVAQVSAPKAERRSARVTVYSSTPGARVAVDGGPLEELPYFADIPAGKHRVVVSAPGFFDAEQEVSGDRPIDVPVNLPLRERPALVSVATNASADLYVDGRAVAMAPIAGPVEVPAGPHVLSLAASGKKVFSQDVTLARGATFRFGPKLETSGQRWVAYTLLATGGAALLTGAATALLAVGQEARAKDIEAERAAGNVTPERLEIYNHSIDQRDTLRDVALVSTFGGALLAAGGAVVWLTDRPAVSSVPARSVEPTTTPKPHAPNVELSARPILAPGTWGAGAALRF